MKMKLYVIRDKVAEESGPVFEAKNDGVAWRKYQELLSQSQFSGDYELRYIGSVDHDGDYVTGTNHPEVVEISLNEGVNDE